MFPMKAKLAVICRQIPVVWRDAFFPISCMGCERLFRLSKRPGNTDENDACPEPAQFKSEMAPFLCPSCMNRFQGISAPMCTVCGMPFASPYGPGHICGSCENSPNHYDQARSVGYYAASLRSVIHRFKYHAATQLAAPLGRLMWHALHHHFPSADIDMVIPVPLHSRRLRSRGFNQSALLVRRWPPRPPGGDRSDGTPWIAAGLLKRHRPTLPQTGLNKAQRADNLKRAFSVPNKVALEGKRVLLVDDVMTTGATANACAYALKKAGAARVDVVTLARAV